MTVASIWDRARRWLEPRGAAGWLRAPASPDMLTRAEVALGFGLPDDLRTSFATHDGQDGDAPALFAGVRLLSLADVVAWNRELRDSTAARGLPPGIVRDLWDSPRWLPIAADDGGNHVALDLDPAPRGVTGQLVYVYAKHPDRPRIATSFTAFLDARVMEWESGQAEAVLDEDGQLERMRLRPRWPGV